jgi:hypothetical protein
MNLPRILAAVVIVLSLLAAPLRAQDFNDQIEGPRQQVSVVGSFNGDTFFKRPTRGISVTNNEPNQPVSGGSAVVESLSGTVLLPRGQHLLEAQILDGYQDPVRSEVLATLDFRLVAVAPEGNYYALHLRGPFRVPDLSAFSLQLLRDAAASGEKADVSAVLSVVQPERP